MLCQYSGAQLHTQSGFFQIFQAAATQPLERPRQKDESSALPFPFILFVFCFVFETGSHFAAMAGLKLTMYKGASLVFIEICLLLLPEGWTMPGFVSLHFLSLFSIYCIACIEMVGIDTLVSFLFIKETSCDRWCFNISAQEAEAKSQGY